jgi:predicted nucleic acid-binding protein
LQPPIATRNTTELVRICSPAFTWQVGRSLVPAPVVAEVGYLLARIAGPKIEAAFLRSIVQQTLSIIDLQVEDYERMAELVETYADFPLGTTDAAVIAVAERLDITEIATLDRRHFHAVRPRHADAFTLLP